MPLTHYLLKIEPYIGLLTMFSLILAIRQFSCASAVSAANLSIKLDETIKSASENLDNSDTEEENQLIIGDLLNICEISSAVILDGAIYGNSKLSLIRSINNAFEIIDDGRIILLIKGLKTSDATYINIYYYLLRSGICPQIRAALMPIHPVPKATARYMPWLLQ